MVRKIVMVLLVVGLFGAFAATDGNFVSKTYGAQWYPFYGYHRPSYLNEPCVVSSQPVASEASAPSCPPPEKDATPARSVVSRQCSSAQWYPFYGYKRPSYLDR